MDDDAKIETPQVETPASDPVEETPKISEAGVKALMEFDPFGPPEPAKEGQDETGNEGDEPKPGGEEVKEGEEPSKTDEPKPGEPAPTEPPKQQGPTQREQELAAQVAQLTQVIQQSQQKPQEQKPEQIAADKYNLGLPPKIIEGLRSDSDEEFATAMHAVVNGIANKLWNDFQEQMQKEYIPQIDQRAGAVYQQTNEMRKVHDEFYGKYPHLQNPNIAPIVQRAAMQVAQNRQMLNQPVAWDATYGDEVAALVHQIIPAPQAQPQAQPQPKPKQFQAQPGTRPAAPAANPYADVL